MKLLLTVAIPVLIMGGISCNSAGNQDAIEQARQVQQIVKENSPGFSPTTTEYYMRAKINGREWAAEEMMASDDAGRIIGQTKGDHKESISLPFTLRYAKNGEVTNFKNSAADLVTNDEEILWGGNEGEMTFTNVGNNFAEGKFNVIGTANGSTRKLVVTDGVFRIPITGK